MKVYVVTTGSYSDYAIDRVFTDKALADAYFADLYKVSGGDADMTEHEADVPQTQVVRQYWLARIDLLTGRIEEVRDALGAGWYAWANPGDRAEAEEVGKPAGRVLGDVRTIDGALISGPTIHRFAVARSYVSQEHANKVAAEIRQRVLRQVGGVGNLVEGDGYLLRVKGVVG